MELLIETVEGFENVCREEVLDIGNNIEEASKTGEGLVKASAGDKDVFRVNYVSGTANRVIYLLTSFELEKPSDAYENIEADFEELLDSDQSFAVRVDRHGEHGFSSVDVARETGQKIVDSFKESTGETLSVSLDNPDIVFRLYLQGEKAFFGLDTTGRPLNDRNYTGEDPEVPPILANCLVRNSEWVKGEKLLDPFTRDGTVAIEAGRIASNTPNVNRKFGFVDSKFFQNRDFAEVAEKINQEIIKGKTGVTASDKDVKTAKRRAKDEGVNIKFEDDTALERSLDGFHIVFDTPYLPEKSKRKEIGRYMKKFEEKVENSNVESVCCTSRTNEFFQEFRKGRKVGKGSFRAWVFRD